jgi:hypothetical protein
VPIGPEPVTAFSLDLSYEEVFRVDMQDRSTGHGRGAPDIGAATDAEPGHPSEAGEAEAAGADSRAGTDIMADVE